MKEQKELTLLLLEGIYNMLMAELRPTGSIVQEYLAAHRRISEFGKAPK